MIEPSWSDPASLAGPEYWNASYWRLYNFEGAHLVPSILLETFSSWGELESLRREKWFTHSNWAPLLSFFFSSESTFMEQAETVLRIDIETLQASSKIYCSAPWWVDSSVIMAPCTLTREWVLFYRIVKLSGSDTSAFNRCARWY